MVISSRRTFYNLRLLHEKYCNNNKPLLLQSTFNNSIHDTTTSIPRHNTSNVRHVATPFKNTAMLIANQKHAHFLLFEVIELPQHGVRNNAETSNSCFSPSIKAESCAFLYLFISFISPMLKI